MGQDGRSLSLPPAGQHLKARQKRGWRGNRGQESGGGGGWGAGEWAILAAREEKTWEPSGQDRPCPSSRVVLGGALAGNKWGRLLPTPPSQLELPCHYPLPQKKGAPIQKKVGTWLPLGQGTHCREGIGLFYFFIAPFLVLCECMRHTDVLPRQNKTIPNKHVQRNVLCLHGHRASLPRRSGHTNVSLTPARRAEASASRPAPVSPLSARTWLRTSVSETRTSGALVLCVFNLHIQMSSRWSLTLPSRLSPSSSVPPAPHCLSLQFPVLEHHLNPTLARFLTSFCAWGPPGRTTDLERCRSLFSELTPDCRVPPRNDTAPGRLMAPRMAMQWTLAMPGPRSSRLCLPAELWQNFPSLSPCPLSSPALCSDVLASCFSQNRGASRHGLCFCPQICSTPARGFVGPESALRVPLRPSHPRRQVLPMVLLGCFL